MTDAAGEDSALTPPLERTREQTIDALCEHFANDVMGVEEFERRVEAAHKAASVEELRALLRDLPGGEVTAAAAVVPASPAARGYTMTTPDRVRDRGFAVAIMGGARRRGRWTPARTNFAIAIMGGAELDFREAVMGPGVTELQVFTMWGGVEIIVPPGMNVESHGIGIIGGFEHAAEGIAPDPAAPTLRISGMALMGGVDITVRHVGESARDARRRRRQERREQLCAARDGAEGAPRDVRGRLRRPSSGPR